MIRERLRKWLGIEENSSELSILKTELSLLRENLNAQISQLREEIETALAGKVERDELKEILSRIDELEREILLLEKYSLPQSRVEDISQDEMLKQKILDVLSAREEITISELQSLVGCGWKKLYQLLKELEKEGKLKREKKKRRTIIHLRFACTSRNPP